MVSMSLDCWHIAAFLMTDEENQAQRELIGSVSLSLCKLVISFEMRLMTGKVSIQVVLIHVTRERTRTIGYAVLVTAFGSARLTAAIHSRFHSINLDRPPQTQQHKVIYVDDMKGSWQSALSKLYDPQYQNNDRIAILPIPT